MRIANMIHLGGSKSMCHGGLRFGGGAGNVRPPLPIDMRPFIMARLYYEFGANAINSGNGHFVRRSLVDVTNDPQVAPALTNFLDGVRSEASLAHLREIVDNAIQQEPDQPHMLGADYY